MRCLSDSGGTAVIEFKDPDPFQEFTYPGILEAKIAIANYLGIPLAKLPEEDRQKIDAVFASTLLKKEIIDEVRCYFETAHHKEIFQELKTAIRQGKLIAVSGIVGSSKTTTLRKIRDTLSKEKEIIVAKSVSVEKNRVTLSMLIVALFYDLSTEKKLKIPTQAEKKERKLQELITKSEKMPVALFIDEAHDLHRNTLIV